MKTCTLKNGLIAQVEPVEPWVVQDHLFRHAFGAEKALEGKPWDDEGFGAFGLTQEVRDAAFLAVRKLYEKGRGCGVDAVHGRAPAAPDLGARRPCEVCPMAVLDGCVSATAAARTRYLGLFEELVTHLAHDDAVVLTTADFARRSLGSLRTPRKLEGLVVGRYGWSSRRREPVFRIVRADGLQVDLYHRAATLTFRTLFRDAREASRGPLQVLQKGVVPIPGEFLSERAVVSRPFWEGP